MVTISIDDNGQTRFLVNEDSRAFLADNATVRRASHVEPVNRILRAGFYLLRYVFGETGRAGNFTRQWPCTWRINLSPIGGPILPGTFRDRQTAIDAEIQHLNENFI